MKTIQEQKDESKDLAKGFIDSLYYQVKLTEKYCKILAKQLEEKLELEITLDELTALSIIHLHNGDINQRDLAKIIIKDRANTGRMLEALEERGYIKRFEKTKNKRPSNIITLTEAGSRTLEKLANIIKPMFDEVHERMQESTLNNIKNGLIKLREIMNETIEIHI